MKRLAILALPFLAAACVQEGPEMPPVGLAASAAAPSDTCGAAQYAGLIDRPRTSLAGMTLPAGTRVIGPGEAVTTDFDPERLNIEIDGNTDIARIYCG